MGNNSKRTINDVNEEIEKVREQLHCLYNEKTELEHNELDLSFEGKFIEYKEHIMYVEDILRNSFDSNYEFSYAFRGLGFYSVITGYDDATYCEWSYWHEMNVRGNTKSEFEKEVNKIKIITKEDFESKFDKMISNMIEYNKTALDYYSNNENKSN